MFKLTFLVLLATVFVAAENIHINWAKVKPLPHYPEFWLNRVEQPPPGYFEQIKYQGIDQQIANGNIAGRNDFPFKSALISEMTFGDALCGASLVSRWAVLTAASCVSGASNTIIILGASDISNPQESRQVRFRVQSTNFRIHPMFRDGISNSDVAVVRFNFAIHSFTREVSPVSLPTGPMLLDAFASVNSVAMGFGRYSTATEDFSYNLRFIEIVTMPNGGILGCSLRFPGRIDHSHLCTSGLNGRGFCAGDVGAPLVVEQGGVNVQIGIASLFADSGCLTTLPSVFTRITSFIGFIEQHIY